MYLWVSTGYETRTILLVTASSNLLNWTEINFTRSHNAVVHSTDASSAGRPCMCAYLEQNCLWAISHHVTQGFLGIQFRFSYGICLLWKQNFVS
jgi:hypothetical protein